MVDVAGLKIINDLGSLYLGDEILKGVGQGLIGITRKTDTVSRWGGDEFMVLMPDFNGDPEDFSKRIKEVGNNNGIQLHLGMAFYKKGEIFSKKEIIKKVDDNLKLEKSKNESSREILATVYGSDYNK